MYSREAPESMPFLVPEAPPVYLESPQTSCGQALAPAIWPFESANALLVGGRRKRLTLAQVASVLQHISDLPITVDPVQMDRAFGQVLALRAKSN
jgi:hypothetical protein